MRVIFVHPPILSQMACRGIDRKGPFDFRLSLAVL
jgi:hypothetical protein